MNELNPYVKLRLSDTEGADERKSGRWEEGTWGIVLPVGFTLYFFLSSRKFKITNHRPQAVSLKEPETPIPFLKQVCEDLETVGPM